MDNRINGAPRYDIYRNIHRALRACMSDTLVVIGRMDVADPDDFHHGLQCLHDLLSMCDLHIYKETHFIHSALESRRKGSTAQIADEHLEHLDSLRVLREAAAQIAAADIARRGALQQRLYLQLALFVAENFEHMHIEEVELNGALWRSFDDAELMEIEGRIVASIPPAEMMGVLRWMLPNIDHAARVELLRGMRCNAPREAFEGVLAMTQTWLGARDWQKLDAALLTAQAA